jgi:Na+/H+ antiporter
VILGAAQTDLVVAGVLALVAVLLLLAQVLRVPYPILLTIGGLGIGFVPGLPNLQLEPDLVLLIFLPPLLYSAAFFSSLRDLRANLRPIASLSIGLVAATTAAIALVAHAVVPGMPWAAAFVLGAVLSPTDPVAATAIARRLGLPRRVVTVVEGESLINDGTALVIYKTAVAAAVTGSFSLLDAGARFVGGALAGVAIGIAVGWLIAHVRLRLDNPQTEITISILTPYFAYLPAEAAGVSGVLAAVTAGIYLGWRSPGLIRPETRIQAYAVWEVLTFLINSAVFVLIGLQLPHVLDMLSNESTATVVWAAAATSATVIATRLVWVPVLTRLARLIPRVRESEPMPARSETALIAWTGMRGAVSLAAALALPLTVNGGAPFPDRDLIVFLTYVAILTTLVGQGLALPPLARRLGAVGGDSGEHDEETKARLHATNAALERIDELAAQDWTREDTIDRMRTFYDYRRRRFRARHDGDEDEDRYEARSDQYRRAVREVIDAQRRALVQMRNEGQISDDVMRRIERDLDLEETRLEG